MARLNPLPVFGPKQKYQYHLLEYFHEFRKIVSAHVVVLISSFSAIWALYVTISEYSIIWLDCALKKNTLRSGDVDSSQIVKN